MAGKNDFTLHRVGKIRSELRKRRNAPRQGYLGAPDAWVEIGRKFGKCLEGIAIGDEVILITCCMKDGAA